MFALLIATWSVKRKKASKRFTSDPVFKEYDPGLVDEKFTIIMLADDPDTYLFDTSFQEHRRAA